MTTDKDKSDTDIKDINMANSERENNYSKPKQNKDFVRHGVYTPRSLNIQYGTDKTDRKKYEYSNNNDNDNYKRENKFKFKNSLVITPFYEIEFNASGGIKYIKSHEDRVFFTNDSIFVTTNGIQKIPVLLKRGINKQSMQKKLIVEEKYNYEEKYKIYKNIILYYEENRVDYQITFNKSEPEPNHNIKDITTEFSLNISIPGIDDIATYKKYNGKQEYNSFLSGFSNGSALDGLEYISVGCGKKGGSCMTVYPDKKLLTEYKKKSLDFAVSNIAQPRKNYINLKIYLENYKVT